MNEKPILFSGEMIRAILDGRKTQTRRAINPQPQRGILGVWSYFKSKRSLYAAKAWVRESAMRKFLPRDYSPYGQPGDTLWVKESWTLWSNATDWHVVSYAAEAESDGATLTTHPVKCERELKILSSRGKKNSLWMPREFSRITLRVKSVRVERVQEIKPEDCETEGISGASNGARTQTGCAPSNEYRNGNGLVYGTPCEAFESLWDSINAKRGLGWSVNPWVWVVEFQKVE